MSLAAYSYGLAAMVYSVFAFSLMRAGLAKKGATVAQVTFLAAVAASAAWGWMGFAAQVVGNSALFIASSVLDLVRYGAWFVFALVLLRAPKSSAPVRNAAFLGPLAALIVAAGALLLVAALLIDPAAPLARFLPLASLSLPCDGAGVG